MLILHLSRPGINNITVLFWEKELKKEPKKKKTKTKLTQPVEPKEFLRN